MKILRNKLYILSSVFAGILAPFNFTFAQNTGNSCSNSMDTLADVFNFATCLLSRSVIPLLITVALVAFMYGVIQYLINAEDENKRKEGRKFMLWGIISLFVMLGIFGILQVLGNTFDIQAGGQVSDITPQF